MTRDDSTGALPSGSAHHDREDTGSPTGELVALVGTTTRVYADCLLPNGALVEAPAHLPFYPATARDTLRCRPGLDLPLAVLAMATLGRDVRTPLLRWLVDRAAGFTDDGLLHRVYHVHGPSVDDTPDHFGTALLLYAICDGHSAPVSPLVERVSRSVASALAIRWDGQNESFRDHSRPGAVVWAAELNAVATALAAAGTALGISEWSRLADQLRPIAANAIERALQQPSLDERVGSREESLLALLGLGWPFHHGSAGLQATRAAEQMMMVREPADRLHREHLLVEDAVRPFELFWLATALAHAEQQRDALRYFNLGVATADLSGHFPERAGPIDLSLAPRPYLLSHLLFLVAADATRQLERVPLGGYSGQRRV